MATGPRGRLYALKDRSLRLLAQTGERLVVSAPAAGAAFAAVTNGAAGILRPAAAAAPGLVRLRREGRRSAVDASAGSAGKARRRPARPWRSRSVRARARSPTRRGRPGLPPERPARRRLPVARFFQWKADLSPNAKGESPSVERVDMTYAERNARPVLENVAVLEPGVVFGRAGSPGAGVLSVTNPDENGIFAGLDQPRDGTPSEGPGRRLWRKGFRTITWKGADPNGDVAALRGRGAARGWAVVPGAQGRRGVVPLVRHDGARRREIPLPRHGLRPALAARGRGAHGRRGERRRPRRQHAAGPQGREPQGGRRRDRAPRPRDGRAFAGREGRELP